MTKTDADARIRCPRCTDTVIEDDDNCIWPTCLPDQEWTTDQVPLDERLRLDGYKRVVAVEGNAYRRGASGYPGIRLEFTLEDGATEMTFISWSPKADYRRTATWEMLFGGKPPDDPGWASNMVNKSDPPKWVQFQRRGMFTVIADAKTKT